MTNAPEIASRTPYASTDCAFFKIIVISILHTPNADDLAGRLVCTGIRPRARESREGGSAEQQNPANGRSGERTAEKADRTAAKPFDHGRGIDRLGYSPDGKVLATTSFMLVNLWDAKSGKKLSQNNSFGFEYAPPFSPDGKILATLDVRPDPSSNGQKRMCVVQWDTATGRELRRSKALEGRYFNLTYSPDGSMLAANQITNERTVAIFDAATLAVRTTIQPEFTGNWAPMLTFTRDGKSLIFMENPARLPQGNIKRSTGLITISRIDDGDTPRIIRAPGLISSYDPALSPDGTLLAVVLIDGTVGVVSLKTSRPLHRLDGGYEADRVRLVFSPDGRKLVTGGKLKQGKTSKSSPKADPIPAPIQVWDMSTGRKTLQIPNRPKVRDTRGITGLSISPDGKTLASSTDETIVRFWDLARGEPTSPGDPGRTP